MTDYKDTLNLPQTNFAMKANLANREPAMLKFWNEIDVYGQLRQQRQGKPQFILHDGPPYANGHIHLGHALNKTLKDIIVKAKSLSGFDAPYVPGWDCHGLPIELNVEKKLGKAGGNISAAQFRQKCRDYAQSQIDLQREDFKRLGIFGDWANPYTTMNFTYEANIIRALGKVIENDMLRQGFKPVHWCMDCQSALAEAEVEYEDKSSTAVDVRFAVLDDAAFLDRLTHSIDHVGQGDIFVPIWTTTPWTLPANQAVALNPKLEYALVQCDYEHKQERLLIAEALVKDAMSRYGIEKYRVVAYGAGAALEGLLLQHPFYSREVPIVLGDHVTTEAGTGNVHTAPGHGQDDYVMAQKYKLAIDNPVADNGCFKADTPLFAGEHVLKANNHIIEVLQAKGALLHVAVIQHSYPHCWRHKTPVIFRATPQWFIDLDQTGLRRDVLEQVFKTEWIPDWGQARIAGMIANRPDWCISRQRMWGSPITLFVDKDTKTLHPATAFLLEEVAKRVEEKGIEAWFDLKPEDLIAEDAHRYQKITDTLDVWFDSGASHFAVLQQRPDLHYPADLYLEGSDQHRGWFQSSILSSVAINGTAPFRQVLTHGFTIDSQGRKMSKSLGNGIEPDQIIKTLGADILRLWVAATDYRSELTLSDEILQRTSDTYRRIRNTARFLLSNLFDFDPQQHSIPVSELLALDRFVVLQARRLQQDIIDAYDNYQFHVIYQKVHNFCAQEMGSFFLDIIKDRQYTMPKDSLARRSCQTAMYHVAEFLVRWLAPILSFTAEEIWQHLPSQNTREKSVFLTTWYDQIPEFTDEGIMNADFWRRISDVRDAVNKELEAQRAAGIIGSGLAADVILYADESLTPLLEALGDELRFVLITSTAAVVPLKNKSVDAVASAINNLYIKITASAEQKCARCWHRRADVGNNAEHPELCVRCVDNVVGEGEQRQFA